MSGAQLKTRGTTIDGLVDHVLAGIGDHPTVILGPVVWRPGDNARLWFFVCASGARGTSRFEVDQMVGPSRGQAVDMRAQLVIGLTQRPPIVIHDFDDELAMARCCEAVWPSAKARQIRQGIAADRARVDG